MTQLPLKENAELKSMQVHWEVPVDKLGSLPSLHLHVSGAVRVPIT